MNRDDIDIYIDFNCDPISTLLWEAENGDTDSLDKLYKLAEEGNADAQNSIGWMYQNQSIAWYRKAAAQGHTDAKCNLKYL